MAIRAHPQCKAVLQKSKRLILSVVPSECAGAVPRALLLGGSLFFLLAAYYVLKTVREALILSEGGAALKSYTAAGQTLLLLFFVPAYGAFARRVNAVRLIGGVSVFFTSHLLGFCFLGLSGLRVGWPFSLWLGIFNVVVIAQLWAFATDVFNESQGKRLFPIIGLGGSLGGWGGACIASRLFPLLGPYRLMLLASSLLVCSVVLACLVGRGRPTGSEGIAPLPAQKPAERQGGFGLIRNNRYLLLIAILVLLMNTVNSTGEYVFGRLVVREADRIVSVSNGGEALKEVFIGQFYARFFGYVNLLSVLFQLVLVSRILKKVSVPGALFILPSIALASYGLLAAAPVLSFVVLTKLLENSANYSIQTTAMHALFLPASRAAKYQAKTAIDSFFSRAGDLGTALVVFLGTRLAADLSTYASINLVLLLLGMLVGIALYRENQKRASFC